MAVEERRSNFNRVASRRTERILEAIRSLKKCSNKKNYAYEKKDIIKIFKAINDELRTTKAMFDDKIKKGKFEL